MDELLRYLAARADVLVMLAAVAGWAGWVAPERHAHRLDQLAAGLRRLEARLKSLEGAGLEAQLKDVMQREMHSWQTVFRENVRSQYRADALYERELCGRAESALERVQILHEALDAAIKGARNNWTGKPQAADAEVERIKAAVRGALPAIEPARDSSRDEQ